MWKRIKAQDIVLTGFHRDPFISFNGESPYQTCDSPIKEEGDPVDPVSTPRGGRNGAGTEILGQLFTFIILKSWPKISQFRHAFLPPLQHSLDLRSSFPFI